MIKKYFTIYHNNCADGFASACIVNKLFPESEFFGGTYGEEPPLDQMRGKDVLLVDFSYKRPEMDAILEVANTVTVIDHHKSAEKELEGFMSLPGVSGIFDMTKSGAMLTYEYFWNGDRNDKELASIFWMKRAIEYIQDRDLWKFELEGSKEYSMAVFSYEYDFEIWDKEVFSKTPCQLISEGAHLLRKMEKDKKELIAAIAYRGDIGGHNVPMINVPYIYASEIAGLLSEGEKFAAAYYETETEVVYSLRSRGDFDVSALAERFGGGGHKNAAGFRVKRSKQ